MFQAFILMCALVTGSMAHSDTVSTNASDEHHIVEIEGEDPYELARDLTNPNAPHLQPPPPGNMSVPAKPLNVSYDRMSKMTSSLRSKLNLAKSKLNKVFASRAFYLAILAHRYGGSKSFAQNGGLSNEQIYDKIQAGKETFSKFVDHKMNLELEAYYERTDVVGYTFTNSRTIYVNRKFYDQYTSAQIARNLMHEWLHKIGFKHDVGATSRRPYTVPYAIGSIAERLTRNI